jgi:hypothetical protein
MRMKHVVAVALVTACTTHPTSSSSTEPVLSGDDCAVHVDQMTCHAESGCMWFGYGRPCPPDGSACPAGVCQGPTSGGGTGSGSGTACACPDGGVCFEQIGGPAVPAGDPEIACTTPAAGDGDPCTRIVGEGTCSDSPTVGGLCVCDNGER